MKKISLAAVAVLALTVTGCASGASEGGSDQYLEAVCPSELALTEYQAALDAQDLAAATTKAGLLATALETTIADLSSSATWAEGIDPADVATLHDAYAQDLKKLQALAAPGTIGDKPFVFAYPGSDEATWRIHKTLELPKTLADACSAADAS
ncbi:hypothetical protein ACX3O0_08645 [Homoserinimonas sp. A447]